MIPSPLRRLSGSGQLAFCLGLAALLLAGCRGEPQTTDPATAAPAEANPSPNKAGPAPGEEAPPAGQPAGAEAPPAPPPLADRARWPLDPRGPADFARGWAAAKRAPPEQRGLAGKALYEAWRNRRYTWTGYALAGLCVEPTRTCAINVWERRSTPDYAALGGAFPLVRLSPTEYGKLKLACKGQKGCVVRFTGALAELITDPSEPLVMTFEPSTIESTRAPTAEEQWFGGRATPTPPRGKADRKLGTGAPTVPPIKLKPRVF